MFVCLGTGMLYIEIDAAMTSVEYIFLINYKKRQYITRANYFTLFFTLLAQ